MNKDTDTYTFIALTLVGIVFLFLNLIPGAKFAKNLGLNIIFPAVKLAEYPLKSSEEIYQRTRAFSNLFDENKELKKSVEKFNRLYKDFNYIKKENKRLNNLLDFKSEQEGELIPARRIAQNTENYFTDFNLNVGKRSGIEKDSPVVLPQNNRWVLLGRISKVFKDYSKATLITSPAFKCGVEIGNGYGGVLEGKNSWIYKIKYISPMAEIEKGDKVYTSGGGGIFPGGLYIGKVWQVDTLSFSKGKEALVKGEIYPQDVKYMFIQKKE
ncbi:MAG: rod shape-determining protein MreC [Elusimicrobiota bacterium]